MAKEHKAAEPSADGELWLYFPVNAKLLSHFDQRFTIQQLHV